MTDELAELRGEVERLRVNHAALALDRARLYEREQQARHHVEVLARVSRRFAETTLDVGALDRIAAEISSVMNATVDIVIDRAPGERGPGDTVVLPLRAHGRLVGTFTAARRDDQHAFTPDDRQLLEELVDRAAITIENSRLYRDNQQARSRAEQLYLFAQAVVTADHIEQVFDAALENIQRAVGARRTSILTADSDGAMRFRAWRGLSDAYRRTAEDRSPWPRHVSMPAPVLIPDVELARDLERELPLLREEVIGSLACFPIVLGSRVIGKISVYYDQPHDHSSHDLELAMSIANHLASVIHRFETMAKLEDAVRYGELFTGILAHDLRNPLNTISTTAQLVLRRHRQLGDTLTNPIDHITTGCEQMARMIDQLLDFSHARVSGGIQIHRGVIDLADVCNLALAQVRALFPAHEVRFDSRGDCAGKWDRDRMIQVCSNLIVNAVQHGNHEAAVGIELDGTNADAVALRVHNSGAIPSAVLPTLFDAFGSAERRRQHSGGLGLGLFIVRELVAAHGGTVHVTSSEERGTTFALQLPRSPG